MEKRVMTDVQTIVASLTKRQGEVLAIWPDAWMTASEVLGYRIAGNTASILADKGLFERRSDPNAWGRSQYRLTADGLAVREELVRQREGG